MPKYLIYYFITINLWTFLNYGIDKRKAIKNHWRISESYLYTLSILGGFIGSMIGMKVFHHKTKKPFFYIINFLTVILYIGIFLKVA